MTYELAKMLKDAGFSQEGDGFESDFLDTKGNSDVNVFRPNVYYPTLSELIDFIDGSDKLKDIENDYIQKALFKLQKNKDT